MRRKVVQYHVSRVSMPMPVSVFHKAELPRNQLDPSCPSTVGGLSLDRFWIGSPRFSSIMSSVIDYEPF